MNERAALVSWWLGRLGWPALVAIGLALFALAFHFSGVAPAQAKLAQLQAEIAKVQRKALVPAGQESRQAARKMALQQRFAPMSERESLIQQIHETAERRGVELSNVEYKLVLEAGAPLARCQLLMPVKASYPALRAWLADIMNSMPSAALDEFNLRRDSLALPMVNGQIKLSLYLDARATLPRPASGVTPAGKEVQ